jgi:biopolymer transport protein ExbD
MSVSIEQKGGRRRSLDAALNLVPFIDLLSCCIAFLLITAVWSQSAQITARTRSPEGEEVPAGADPARPWTLTVGADELTLRAPDGREEAVAPEALSRRLAERAVGEEMVVHAVDGVPYARWIRALDSARAAGVVHLDVSL